MGVFLHHAELPLSEAPCRHYAGVSTLDKEHRVVLQAANPTLFWKSRKSAFLSLSGDECGTSKVISESH